MKKIVLFGSNSLKMLVFDMNSEKVFIVLFVSSDSYVL